MSDFITEGLKFRPLAGMRHTVQHADSTSLESFNKRNKLRNSEYLLIGFATIIIYHKAFQIVIEIQLLLTVLFSGFKRKLMRFLTQTG